MPPHLLLLTSAQEIGGPLLVPIASIMFAVPMSTYSRIFLANGEYLDVTESFEAIIEALGGLVMRPRIKSLSEANASLRQRR